VKLRSSYLLLQSFCVLISNNDEVAQQKEWVVCSLAQKQNHPNNNQRELSELCVDSSAAAFIPLIKIAKLRRKSHQKKTFTATQIKEKQKIAKRGKFFFNERRDCNK